MKQRHAFVSLVGVAALVVSSGALLGVFSLTPAHAAGCTINWTGAISGNWSDPGNWSPNQVPNSGDFACIPASYSGAVTVDSLGNNVAGVDAEGGGGLIIGSSGALQLSDPAQPSTIKGLNLSGGTLTLDRTPYGAAIALTLLGDSTWSGGSIVGTALAGTPSTANGRVGRDAQHYLW